MYSSSGRGGSRSKSARTFASRLRTRSRPATRSRTRGKGLYTGHGLYTGRGKYGFDTLKRGIGMARSAYQKFVPESQRKALASAARDIVRTGIDTMHGMGVANLDTTKGHLGDLANAYLGSGGYNELVKPAGGYSALPITMSSTGDETSSVCITNREYIGDIFGPETANFNNQAYSINPALPGVFPWLSQIACNYDEYEFVQLVFEYHPTINETSTASSGQSGTLIMVTDYNPSHAPFSDKEQMMQYHGGQSDRVTALSIHGVECDPSKSSNMRRYTRVNPVVPGQDVKNFDVGLFQIGINNIPNAFYNQQLGELWVYYKVMLHVPKLGSARGNSIQQDIFVSDAPYGAGASGMSSLFVPLNTVKAQQNNLGCTIITDTMSEPQAQLFNVLFPANATGDYEVEVLFSSDNYRCQMVMQTDPETPGEPFTYGQCLPVYDVLPTTLGYGYNWYIRSLEGPVFSYEDAGTGVTVNFAAHIYMCKMHVRCRAAVGGGNNYLSFALKAFQQDGKPSVANVADMQMVIKVTERNSTFAQSSTNPAPVLIDANGLQTNMTPAIAMP